MQATDVFATIANNGVLVHPHVVAGYTDATGSYHSAPIDAGTRVVSSATASAVRMMLESVVSDQGTAPEAAIPGYRVAGKTGTAMLAGKNCRCYDGYTASFIGFAPADAPAYVVSVKISQPQGAHFGGQLGGPVFKKVMSFVLQQRQIAPTAPATYHYPLTESELAGALPTKSAVTAKGRLKAVLNGQKGGKH
jgi:cell division protein FtsI (penicillin-binding protein 3)